MPSDSNIGRKTTKSSSNNNSKSNNGKKTTAKKDVRVSGPWQISTTPQTKLSAIPELSEAVDLDLPVKDSNSNGRSAVLVTPTKTENVSDDCSLDGECDTHSFQHADTSSHGLSTPVVEYMNAYPDHELAEGLDLNHPYDSLNPLQSVSPTILKMVTGKISDKDVSVDESDSETVVPLPAPVEVACSNGMGTSLQLLETSPPRPTDS